MQKAEVFTNNGEKKESVNLSKALFGRKPNAKLVSQYVRVYLANQTQGTHKNKVRDEVSGGGKKPWRQKGTGRARSGSNRSPVWVGGGIVHGPVPYTKRLTFSKKMREVALKSVFSSKALKKAVTLIDELNFKKARTKDALSLIIKIGAGDSALFIIDPDKKEELKNNAINSFRNLKNYRVVLASSVNPFMVELYKKVVIEQNALKYLEKKYA